MRTSRTGLPGFRNGACPSEGGQPRIAVRAQESGSVPRLALPETGGADINSAHIPYGWAAQPDGRAEFPLAVNRSGIAPHSN